MIGFKRISACFCLLVLAGCGWVEVPPEPGQTSSATASNAPGVTSAPSPSRVQSSRLSAPVSEQRQPIPANGLVRVQKGDTVYALSRRYGTPVRAIIEENSLKAPFHLKAGQEIRLVQGQYHKVQAGETLYSVSRKYRTDVFSLARANNLSSPYILKTGQTLKLPVARPPITQKPSPTRAQAVAPKPTTIAKSEPRLAKNTIPKPPPRASSRFSWPLRGQVISRFGAKKDGLRNDGINIAAARGTPVKAAENGVVAYSGNELRGFGNMLLIKHDGGWITAYAHNENILVKRGQKVKKGQTIARVGSSGGVVKPQLHFEIRRGMNPVDPKKHLGG